MKLFLFYAALVLFFTCCDKEAGRLSSPRYKPLVGTWKLSEVQMTNAPGKPWQPVPYHQQNDLNFQPTGVVLDYKGEPVCCHPKEWVLNGSIELVNYPAQELKNSDCSIACVQCQVWSINYSEGEMIITGCVNTDVRKYKR